MIRQIYHFIRKSWVYDAVHPIYTKCVNFRRYKKRKPLIPLIAKELSAISGGGDNTQITNKLSIISSNCFAGRIMQDLKMEYNSPTLGLYFWAPDYIEFLTNLPHYLKADIEFVEHSKYPLGDVRRNTWSHWYPIGLLDGKVEIHFLHYHTEKEAAEKWHRRASRVNLDNLLVIGMDQNLCTPREVEDFDRLPYKNKIFFSRFDLPLKSNEYMQEFKGCDGVGDAYKYGDIFYTHLLTHFRSHSAQNFKNI